MTPQPTVLSSHSGADFLACLPTLAGFTLREGILVVPFRARRTIGVIRIDAPAADDPAAPDSINAIVVGALTRLSGCDGVVFALYAAAPFSHARRVAAPVLDRLIRGAQDAGFAVKDAFCVAADGWTGWFEQAPEGGRPLAEISRSPLADRAAAARRQRRLPDLAEAGRLPVRDPEKSRALCTVIDELRTGSSRDAFGRPTSIAPRTAADVIDVVESLLGDAAGGASLVWLARMAVLSAIPTCRDAMTLQVAFGPSIHTLPLGEAGELFLGESTRVPDVARVRRGIDVLRHLIAHLAPGDTPDLLCMLAWLHWALGAGTAAGHHAADAARLDPAHTLAPLLLALLQTGKIPEWVYRLHDEEPPDVARTGDVT